MSEPTRETSQVASTDEIREHFPALKRRWEGLPVAYFDGPGGTQVPRMVVDAMSDYLFHHNANTHWAFPSSLETDQVVVEARRAVADFLNSDSEEIAFGNNMTSLTFHLARSLGRRMEPGDEIVVTELDHHANVDPWRALATERGVTIRTVRMRPEDGQLDWDDLKGQVNERTRVLAIGAASNALGTINDIPLAARIAHDSGAMLFVDAVHYAPHRLVDVRAMGCDFLACSAYKFHGPHAGILYGRGELLRSLDLPKLQPAPETAPERFETGTQNHEGMAGTAAAIDFLASLAPGVDRRSRLRVTFDALHDRMSERVAQLWYGLEEIQGVTLFGPGPNEPRTPTISFVIKGHRPAEVCRKLATHAVFASHGDFYASKAVERLGHQPEGLIRIGCACYTTAEDTERLIGAVREISRTLVG